MTICMIAVSCSATYIHHMHAFVTLVPIHTLYQLQIEKTAFHIAAEENSRECMKLLVYHFKVDPDEPDVVSWPYISPVIVYMMECMHDSFLQCYIDW